jgi:hypothetical protein
MTYHGNDVVVHTDKRGVFVTPDKRIQLEMVERQTEAHHKVERMIAYTREGITFFQSFFGIFFGIGARVWYPKSKSEQDRVAKKKAKTITSSLTAGVSDGQVTTMPSTVTPPITVLYPMMKIVKAPATCDIRINTLTHPEEAKVIDKDALAKYMHRGPEGVMLLYEWASHRINLLVGYRTPMLARNDDDLFAVLKAMVDEFSPEEEKVNETYTKKENISFTKVKCTTSCITMAARLLKLPRHCVMMHCCIDRKVMWVRKRRFHCEHQCHVLQQL